MNRTLFPWKKQALRAGVAAGCCDVCGEKRPDYGVNHSYLVGQMGLTSYVQNLKNDGDETGYRATAWRERCRAWLGLLSFPAVPLCVLRRRVAGFLQTESAGLRRSTCGCGELAPLHYEGLKQFFPCWVSIEVNVWMMSHEVNFQPRHRKKAERASFLLDIQLFKTRMAMLQRGIQTSKKTGENITIIMPVDVLKSNSRKQTSITNSKDNNL